MLDWGGDLFLVFWSVFWFFLKRNSRKYICIYTVYIIYLYIHILQAYIYIHHIYFSSLNINYFFGHICRSSRNATLSRLILRKPFIFQSPTVGQLCGHPSLKSKRFSIKISSLVILATECMKGCDLADVLLNSWIQCRTWKDPICHRVFFPSFQA